MDRKNLRNYIDGKSLYMMFLAGAGNILQFQSELNRINVFPVPDSDTGTNLASTVRTVIENVKKRTEYNRSAGDIAEAALDGARGNSGVIFAQFLHGIREETARFSRVDLHDFAVAVKGSVGYVYGAISEPVEGTMITVIREWSEYFYNNRFSKKKFHEVFSDSIEIARRSLRETTGKLKVLAKANVVDAGAKGFVIFLEGIQDFFKNLNFRKLLSFTRNIRVLDPLPEHIDRNISFRYCAETVIEGDHIDRDRIMALLKENGDSIVVAGTGSKTRVHIHTNTPADIFFRLREFGHLTGQKADDMKLQTEVAHNRKYEIALVTDSTCDLPGEILEKFQIHMVPQRLNIGDSDYLDKVTITPNQVYNLLDSTPEYPKSAQPSLKSFENMYSFLSTHYKSIISVHLSSELSGTWSIAKKAAEKIGTETGATISVINSKQLSGSLGMIVLRTAEAIGSKMSHKEILDNMDDWINKAGIFVSVQTMKYMVRGGRVSPMKGWIAKRLNINPIISVDREGRSVVFGKTFGQKNNMKKVMDHIRKISSGKKIRDSVVLHADSLKNAEWFNSGLKEITGKDPVGVVNISPTVGINAGLGAVAVAIMFE